MSGHKATRAARHQAKRPAAGGSPGHSGSIVAGIQPVLAALKARPGEVLRLVLAQGAKNPRLAELEQLASGLGVRLERLPREQLEELAGMQHHQDVLAELIARGEASEEDLAHLLDALDHPALLLVLDGVTDPHNLGACLRTAEAAGVDAVIVPKDRATGLTPVVRKSSAGAAELVPLVQVTNLARTLRALKERGIWLAGTSDEAPADIYGQDLTGALALVMGSEGQGIRRLTADLCDYLVSIPMAGAIESLNVSVATGVCLYEIRRQQRTK
jgi:23S rRNA (guanosine2251-2'-O)-methyltransferase